MSQSVITCSGPHTEVPYSDWCSQGACTGCKCRHHRKQHVHADRREIRVVYTQIFSPLS
ncbi:unnamed protein product, partial [Staurois parvus]